MKRLCLDPGHGGHDPGAQFGGTKEKDIVLMYANLIRADLLRCLPASIEVLQTRLNDTFVPLRRRAQMSNDMNADALVSIHVNSAYSPDANGSWVIYDDAGDGRGEALAREIFLALSGLPGMVDSDTDFEVYADGTPWVGSRQLTVISRAKAPAVLIELGFITNPADLRQLTDPANAITIAETISRTIESYWAITY